MGTKDQRSLVQFYDSHPVLVPLFLQLGCALYAATSMIGGAKNWFTAYPRESNLKLLGDFYLGSASAIAIVAGFAGVVVVFVYSAASPTFVTFRKTAEPELMKNWRTIVVSSFAAAGIFLASALFTVVWSPLVAWFVCMFGLTLSIDAVARVIRQFFVMLRLSRVHDKAQKEKSKL